MAAVYLAQARGPSGFAKHFALKVIHPHLCENDKFRRMFLDEARLSARLNHPNACSVFELGEVDGTYFLAMEYLHGESLHTVLERTRSGVAIPLELLLRILADSARGLHAAHELKDEKGTPLGVVHRDISPQNIFVRYDGVSVIMDFGVAQARDRLTHTETGEVKGKCPYLAPEQLTGAPIDRRCDIFSFGTVLWETTVSRRLFRRESDLLTIDAVLRAPIPSPTSISARYPADLEPIVMQALERDPAQRYQTIEALADDLENFIYSMGNVAGPAQLAQWMKATFADRMAERAALLRADASDDLDPTEPDAPAAAAHHHEYPLFDQENDTSSENTLPRANNPGGETVLTTPWISVTEEKSPLRHPWKNLALTLFAIFGVAVTAGLGGWFMGSRSSGLESGSARARRATLESGSAADREGPPSSKAGVTDPDLLALVAKTAETPEVENPNTDVGPDPTERPEAREVEPTEEPATKRAESKRERVAPPNTVPAPSDEPRNSRKVASSGVASNPTSSKELVDRARKAYSDGRFRACARTLKTAGRSRSVVGLLLLCQSKAGDVRDACSLARRYRDRYSQAAQFFDSRCGGFK